MLAYSYVRFSTPEQLKGDSLRRQLEKSGKYASENGLVLDTSLKMYDKGRSAFDRSNVTKGNLGVFLKLVEEGQIAKGSYLLVEHLDRLSRAEVLDALQQFISIINAGIVIVTLTDRQVYSRETVSANPMLLLVSISIMSSSHDESFKKVERIGAAWDKKLDAAITSKKVFSSRVPLWMTVKDEKIELIPERAEVIRQIFEMMKNGIGQYSIVKKLNASIPSWGKAKEWDQSYLIKLTKNLAVYGAIKLKGQIVDGYYPAVLSRDEFLYISKLRQARRNSENSGNKKGSRLSNLFSGLLICGYCGSRMVMNSSTPSSAGPKVEQKYIVCNGAKTGKVPTCKCVNWQYLAIEQIFLFRCATLNLKTLFGVKDHVDIDALEKRRIALITAIDDQKKKVDNLYMALEEGYHLGLMDRIKGLELEMEDQQKALDEVNREISVKKLATTSGKSRMSLMLKLFKALKETEDVAKLRIVRESIQSQIKDVVEKVELFPTGPYLNKENRDMRFMRVFFKSGAVCEWE